MDSRELPQTTGSFSYGQVQRGLSAAPPDPPVATATLSGMSTSFAVLKAPAEFQGPHVYNGDVYQGVGGFGVFEHVAKKKGRPSKYGPEGNLTPGYTASDRALLRPSEQKKRGRPPGPGKKRLLETLGPFGSDFTPHYITVYSGEDVAAKIMAFSQQGSRTVCIVSASGFISNVALRQPAACGGTATFEGHFEILSLSGSYMLTENGDTFCRTGGLSVTLGSTDGRVVGGGVAGMLTAATPVQVFVVSFHAESERAKLGLATSDPSVPQQMIGFGGQQSGSPQKKHSIDYSSKKGDDEDDDVGSYHVGAYNDSSQQHVPTPCAMFGWSHPLNQPRK